MSAIATVSAFRWVPPFAHGFVRDLRVRWALEEAGLPYEAALVDQQICASADYRAWQPFGQVPAYRDGSVELFESGAIVLYIAARSPALSPQDEAGRARTTAWVLAALNSIEPFALIVIRLKESRAQMEPVLNARLAALAASLGDKDYLEGRFTAGDLVMTTVLRELASAGVLARFPTLDAYRRRCEARPAFARALEAQLQVFRDNQPSADGQPSTQEASMNVQPYLSFEGRTQEALDFYKGAIGATVDVVMHFKDAPPEMQAQMGPDSKDKVMHAAFHVGDTQVMASDGQCTGKASFSGISLTLNATSDAEAEKLFGALGQGGHVGMPMSETFFAHRFGVVADKFGVTWMVIRSKM